MLQDLMLKYTKSMSNCPAVILSLLNIQPPPPKQINKNKDLLDEKGDQKVVVFLTFDSLSFLVNVPIGIPSKVYFKEELGIKVLLLKT